MWQAFRLNGTLPLAGGWMEQPLDVLVRIGAIDLIVRTWDHKNEEGYDWSKFSADQRYLISWAEQELNTW